MSTTGRPARLRPAIQMAMVALAKPIGVSCEEIAVALGKDAHLVSQTLFRMRKAGVIYALGERRDIRYFGSPEARDAAIPAFAEHMDALRQERQARASSTKAKCSRKYKAKVRASKPKVRARRACPQTQTIQADVLGAVRSCTDPLGATLEFIESACKYARRKIFHAIERLVAHGEVFQCGYRAWRRYFTAAEQRDAAEPRLIALRAEIKREKDRIRWAAQSAAKRKSPTPRVAKTKVEKPAAKRVAPRLQFARPERKVMPAPVTVRTISRADFKNAEPIIPAGLKITKCPPCQPRTFRPPEWFKGDFQREWAQLRASKEAV